MSESKSIIFSLNGTEYQISTRISYADYMMSLIVLQDDTTDYQKKFAEFIQKKIVVEDDKRPAVEEIMENGDMYGSAMNFLSSDVSIEMSYNSLLDKDGIYKDFFRTIYNKCTSDFRETIGKLPRYDWAKISNNLFGNIGVRINTEALSSLNSKMSSKGGVLTEFIKSPVFRNLPKIISNKSEMFVRFSESINELMRKIKIPTISEEEKEQIRLAYITWGKFGWTPLPKAPILYFEECPADRIEANAKALKYCKKDNMVYLFDALRRMKGVKKSDLEEAIFCFENRKYKACALLLFGLIDSKLIRLQKDEDRIARNRRRTGGGAAKKISERIKEEKKAEQTFMTLLLCENLFVCLDTVFSDGDDFKNQPAIINRNFVDHGMLTKRVIRKDCVQLFLLYYNLMKVLQL